MAKTTEKKKYVFRTQRDENEFLRIALGREDCIQFINGKFETDDEEIYKFLLHYNKVCICITDLEAYL